MNEVGLPEDVAVQHHAGRQLDRDVVEHGVELVRQDERVSAGLLLHAEDDGGLHVGGRFATFERSTDADFTELRDGDGHAIGRAHDGRADVVQRADAAHTTDKPLRTALVDDASGDVLVALFERPHDLVQRDAERL